MGHYQRLIVDIVSYEDNKTMFKCVTYEKANKNEEIAKPSPAYKNVIINGAIEINLPDDYIKFLRSFDDNGYNGPINIDLPSELYLKS